MHHQKNHFLLFAVCRRWHCCWYTPNQLSMSNPVSHFRWCGHTYHNGESPLFARGAGAPVQSHIPLLYSYGDANYYNAFLCNHIGVVPVDPKTEQDLLHHLDNAGYIFVQPHGVNTTADTHHSRFSCATHTFQQSPGGNSPIFTGDTHLPDCFLSGIYEFGLDLGMPEKMIPLVKVHKIGYDEIHGNAVPNLIKHNDGPALVDDVELRFRLNITLQGKKELVFQLMRYKTDMKAPVVCQDAPEIVVELEGIMAYAMDTFASGTHPLCIDGDLGTDDDGRPFYIIPYHGVENVSGGRALSIIVDYYFPSLDSLMTAMERFRSRPFKLNLSSDALAKKWLYCYDRLRVSIVLVWCVLVGQFIRALAHISSVFPCHYIKGNHHS